MERAIVDVRAIGIVVRRGTVLLVGSNMSPDHWVPPGGHVHPREPAPDAVRREVLEEAGLAVDVRELIASRQIWWPDNDTVELYFAASVAATDHCSDEVIKREDRRLKWAQIDALAEVRHFPQCLAQLCRHAEADRRHCTFLQPLDLRDRNGGP